MNARTACTHRTQANAYDAGSGEVVVDIIRVPKLYLTDTKGRTGSPIWWVGWLIGWCAELVDSVEPVE